MIDHETLARLTDQQQRQIENTKASLRKWIASERAKGTPEAAIRAAMQDMSKGDAYQGQAAVMHGGAAKHYSAKPDTSAPHGDHSRPTSAAPIQQSYNVAER